MLPFISFSTSYHELDSTVPQIAERARACRSNPRSLAESRPWRLKQLDHGSDVTVLENRAPALPRFACDGAHHGPGQVIGPNHLG